MFHGELRKRKRRIQIAAVLWAVLLTVFSVRPSWFLWIFLPSEIYFFLSHVAAYGLFSFLLCLFFAFQKSIFSFRLSRWRVLILGFSLATIWGGLNEMFQILTPDRHPAWLDFGADVSGVLLGVAFFVLFKKFVKHRRFRRAEH
jgi:VanZ family protein